jgi:polar amino acid transport system substrate-binding protein
MFFVPGYGVVFSCLFVGLRRGVRAQLSYDSVVVFTKDAPPFSYEDPNGLALGYTHDFVKLIVQNAYPGAILRHEFVEDNQAIFAALQGHNDSSEIPLGAASISITAEREEVMDFLPSYFTSGVQILVKTDDSLSTRMSNMAQEAVRGLGVVVALVLLVIVMLSPLVWLLETAYSGEKTSAFYVSDSQVLDTMSADEASPEAIRLKRLMLEIMGAFMWVSMSIGGSKLGKAKALPVRAIGLLLSLGYPLILVLATATLSSIFTASQLEANIQSFDDLPGKVVCTNLGTSPDAFVTEFNNGFSVVRSEGFDAMMDEFWMGTCDAVIYDYGLLLHAVQERKEAGLSANAILVDEPLNVDPYGIALPSSHPAEGGLRGTSLDMIRNARVMGELDQKYLSNLDMAGGEQSDSFPASVIYVPFLIGVGIVLAGVLWTVKNKEILLEQERQFQAMEMRDAYTDVNKLRYDTIKKGKSDITLRDAGDLTHEIAEEVRDLKKLMCEVLLHLDTSQDHKNIEELRAMYSPKKIIPNSQYRKPAPVLAGDQEEATILTPPASLARGDDNRSAS